jgi:hypothetical protein
MDDNKTTTYEGGTKTTSPSDEYMPYWVGTFLASLGLPVLTGAVACIPVRDDRRVREVAMNGLLAVGRMLSVKKEWPSVKPIVYFITQDGRRLIGEIRQYVSSAFANTLDIGSIVALRYDPGMPQVIALDLRPDLLDQAEVRRLKDQFLVVSGQAAPREANIAVNGAKTRGLVLASQPTGNVVHGAAEMAFQVRVSRTDGSVFDTTAIQAVPHDRMSLTVPGSIVHVWHLPSSEHDIVLGFPPPTPIPVVHVE